MNMVLVDGDARVELLQEPSGAFAVTLTSGTEQVWERRTIHQVTAFHWFLRGIADELGSYGNDTAESLQIEALVVPCNNL